jgi:hypothetical protein
MLLLWSEGVKTGEIYGRMIVQYCDNCMTQTLISALAKGQIISVSGTTEKSNGAPVIERGDVRTA